MSRRTARNATQAEASVDKVSFRIIFADPAIRTILLIVFVIMMGFGIVAPILPLYARSFGVDYAAAGLLISSFAFTRLAFDLVSGPAVDRLGERLSMAVGVIVVGVTSVLVALARTFALAVVFRAAGGAGSSLMFAAVYSYMFKVVPKDRMARTFGVFFGFFNMGVIAGGPIGGVLAHFWGLRAPILSYAVILFVSGGLYLRFARDPAPRAIADDEEPPPLEVGWRATVERITALLRRREFVTTIMVNLAYMSVVAGVLDTLVPLFGRDHLHMSTLAIGGVYGAAITTELAVLYHAGSLADRWGRKSVLLPGLAGLILAVVAIGWARSPLMLVGLVALWGVASGYAGIMPSAMLSDVVPDRGSGTAIGVHRFFGDLGLIAGPLVAGFTTRAAGFKVAFAVAAALPLIALVLAVRTPETLRRPAVR